jgi:hypothetical protein
MSAQVFKVDLRKYGPGICVGPEKMIVKCPLCGKGAYREEYSQGVRWVHAGTLSHDDAGGLKWKREHVCRRPAFLGGEP